MHGLSSKGQGFSISISRALHPARATPQSICRAIVATDYDGYVGQEFTPKGDPVAALEQAYKACAVE